MISKASPAVYPHVGAALRSLRQDRGIDGLGLAVLADVSQKHLSQIEHGHAVGSLRMLEHLASCLDASLLDLVRRADEIARAETSS